MTERERRKFEQMRSALGRAKGVIKAERALIVEGHCLLDKKLRPRLDTLEAFAKPTIARLDRLLKSIDHAMSSN